ncbi:7528_t:CDS:2 [Gigaspora margarita]|uniref:7528_t:CDS:1 n=1 Tax=Gigaspora margarita TaxID=4874 RepID=A0ABN7USY8_GIGMA|nr:7528_t:CDS:2 [Gigaspora margarita]
MNHVYVKKFSHDKPKNRPHTKELVDKLGQYQKDIMNYKAELYEQVEIFRNST